jgi:hypothetical protein
MGVKGERRRATEGVARHSARMRDDKEGAR